MLCMLLMMVPYMNIHPPHPPPLPSTPPGWQVLEEIPGSVPLADVAPLLAAMLQHGLELSRNLAVVRNLCKYENLAASEDLVQVKSGRVVLTAERACCLCHKRIGSSVLVVYPSGSLAHYNCHQRNGLGAPLGAPQQ